MCIRDSLKTAQEAHEKAPRVAQERELELALGACPTGSPHDAEHAPKRPPKTPKTLPKKPRGPKRRNHRAQNVPETPNG
eukprot:1056371-Pyramimonas_sp.AAC.1